MEETREHLVELLRRMGRPDVAEAAMQSLPERMDRSDAEQFVMRYGVTMDQLISEMGGSP
jgi:hypothetical protein